jgi:hypothetical protein
LKISHQGSTLIRNEEKDCINSFILLFCANYVLCKTRLTETCRPESLCETQFDFLK